MIGVIGDASAQQMPRMGIYASGTEKDIIAQKAERVQRERPVEKSSQSSGSKLQGNAEESGHNRTLIEDGKVVLERYDEDGKLIKRTPPGYLPFGEIA
jgi:hypothetical protein